uniref:Uncharacterized protein n=1 Tax=Syphacia muris TaxID=451379 RepID=A0A0N5AS21_9BILA
LYKSSNAYPYPRTHSLVVVPSTRPIAPEDDETSLPYTRLKQRPPLNRAIPPIPESRSNDSIMTQTSERRSSANETKPSSIADNNNVKTQKNGCYTSVRDPSNVNSNEPQKKLESAKVQQHLKNDEDDCSIVIENKLAHSLASKSPVALACKKTRLSETPKSPLLCVAHSVLSKIGNRFARNDTRQSMRTTTSMSR